MLHITEEQLDKAAKYVVESTSSAIWDRCSKGMKQRARNEFCRTLVAAEIPFQIVYEGSQTPGGSDDT